MKKETEKKTEEMLRSGQLLNEAGVTADINF
jgi:hypothetical protein